MNKNILLIISLFASLGILSSCKKDYNCSCTAANNGIAQTYVIVIPNATSADASAICKSNESYAKGQTQDTECKLE